MDNRIRRTSMAVFLFQWLTILACAAVPMLATSQIADTEVEFPIVTFSREHPLLPGSQQVPQVQVLSSGFAIVTRAKGYKRPGVYRIQLAPEIFNRINLLVQQQNTASSDNRPASVEAVSPSPAGNGDLVIDSDPTTVVMGFAPSGIDQNVDDTNGAGRPMREVRIEQSTVLQGVARSNALGELYSLLLQLFTQAGKQ